MVDDVRRRRCAPVVTWVKDGEARLMISQREVASWLGTSLAGSRVAESVGAKA